MKHAKHKHFTRGTHASKSLKAMQAWSESRREIIVSLPFVPGIENPKYRMVERDTPLVDCLEGDKLPDGQN